MRQGSSNRNAFPWICIVQINGPCAKPQASQCHRHLQCQSNDLSREDSAPFDPGVSYRPLGKGAIDFHA
jgi:hypothetical protein